MFCLQSDLTRPTPITRLFGLTLCALSLFALTPAIVKAQGVAATQPPPRKGKSAKAAGKKVPVAHRNLLLFPIDAEGEGAQYFADLVTDVVKGRLATADLYEVDVYRSSLAGVRRALRENTVSDKGASAPYDSISKVQKLTGIAGYDLAVNGSVDYSYDSTHHQATLSISLGILDLSGGKVVPRNFADSVTTAENSVKDPGDHEAAEKATRELAEKMMSRLLEPPAPPDASGKNDGKPAPGK